MKRVVILLFLCLSLSSLVAQTKEDDIRKLLEMTGSADLGVQVMNSIIGQFRQILPEVPDDYWNEFMGKATADEMILMIIPIYDRHFTHQEIRDIISFYETPTGQKLITKLPQVTRESMTAGSEWGRKLGEEIQQKLVDDGLLEI